MEQDFELASQVKSWYDMESCGALKQVDPRSSSDARAHEIPETPPSIMEKDTKSECYGLKITTNCPTIISQLLFN